MSRGSKPGERRGGRQRGTPNKDKPFREALRAELDAAGKSGTTLRKVVKALLDQAAEGNTQAIREVADRLDGKVPQAIGGVDENENLTPLWSDEERSRALAAFVAKTKKNPE